MNENEVTKKDVTMIMNAFVIMEDSLNRAINAKRTDPEYRELLERRLKDLNDVRRRISNLNLEY